MYSILIVVFFTICFDMHSCMQQIMLHILQVPRGRLCDLFTKAYARTSIQLFLLWLGVACIYYGVILTQSEILEMGGACGAGICYSFAQLLCTFMLYTSIQIILCMFFCVLLYLARLRFHKCMLCKRIQNCKLFVCCIFCIYVV